VARIALFEPYYGGSHRSFIDGLTRLPHHFQLHTLPANRWKWRMRLAAPFWAGRIRRGEIDLSGVDVILCSSYLDVAAFKGLLPPALAAIPICVYFHENQFAYPVRAEDPRDLHFALTNLTTALAADRLAFNSRYNLETLLSGCLELLGHGGDMGLADYQAQIRANARILAPGLDVAEIDRQAVARHTVDPVPVIVWNHRWEHDKDPDLFFTTLFDQHAQGVAFRLLVLGEAFRERPAVFARAQEILADRIDHFGHLPSRAAYLAKLSQADIVVSTARHEFFGLSVLEAVRAGCRPLVPRRLVYPELFGPQALYDDQELGLRLRAMLGQGRLPRQQALELTERFSWQALLPGYDEWLTGRE
jgi:glycosyltransferase involved in cell wall biosynthesis